MGWQKIKNEYIAGEATLKELSAKYDVSFSTIQKKSSEEGWRKLRKKKQRKVEEKIIDSVSSKEAKRATNIADVADKLLDKISELMDTMVVDTQSVKHLTSALKDLKEIKGIKSDADMREQEARIRALEENTKKSKEIPEIKVVFGDGGEDLAQ